MNICRSKHLNRNIYREVADFKRYLIAVFVDGVHIGRVFYGYVVRINRFGHFYFGCIGIEQFGENKFVALIKRKFFFLGVYAVFSEFIVIDIIFFVYPQTTVKNISLSVSADKFLSTAGYYKVFTDNEFIAFCGGLSGITRIIGIERKSALSVRTGPTVNVSSLIFFICPDNFYKSQSIGSGIKICNVFILDIGRNS